MSRVSARALDEAIAWQLCLDSGEATEQERHEFRRWLEPNRNNRPSGSNVRA